MTRCSVVMIRLFSFGLFLSFALVAFERLAASDPPTAHAHAAINAVLQPILEKHKLPGLTGVIVQGDQVKGIGAVGVRKDGAADAFTVNDQVHIGSCTKAMTAALLAKLVERDKLTWQTTVGDTFPDAKDVIHPDYHKVTLLQLLQHRGGMPANALWSLLGRDKSTTQQRETLLRTVLKNPPKEKPGTHFHYSNVGYAVAGLMAEKVTGESWETLMRKEIFEPLKMTSAGFGAPGTRDKIDQPWGHTRTGDKTAAFQTDNAPSIGPAGTVHCSMTDWAKFAIVHLRGARAKNPFLQAGTFQVLHTPPEGQEYACGWGVVERPWAKGKALHHSGSNTMWFATVWIAPQRDVAALVATNLGGENARKACDAAVEALIRFVARE